MKTLNLFLCVLAASAAAQTVERGPQSRDIEIITPLTTNLFVRATNTPTARSGNNVFAVGASTNRLDAAIRPGRSTNLNTVTLTNRGVGTPTSGLIGPVFPARDTTLSPTGRPVGSDVLTPGTVGPTGVPMLTNAIGAGPSFGSVPETTAPGPSAPLPGGSPPLAPPTSLNPPTPAVPGSPSPSVTPGSTPNSAPTVPGSITPGAPNTAPLAPPSGPALPPTSPAPPAPAPGGTGGGTGAAGTR